MSEIKKMMPVMYRHEGDWDGSYIHLNIKGEIIDTHRAQLSCSFPDHGPNPYYQINRYSWKDGKKEEIHFPGTYKDKRIWFDNDRIYGSVWELDNRSLALTWTRKDIPTSYLYELIQISSDDSFRTRTWHWFKDDRCFQRTIIQEEKVK